MSITTYSELQTAIGTWSKRADLSSLFPDFIRMAELRIGRDMRIKAMEESFSDTIASGVIALPTRYASLKVAYISQTPVVTLQRKVAEWVLTNYPVRASDGVPKFIARSGESFIFGPYPDSAYTVAGIYYRRFEALSDTNPAGWLVVNAPDLILFASLLELSIYAEDDGNAARWDSRYQNTLQAVQREDQQEDVSGGPLAVTVR